MTPEMLEAIDKALQPWQQNLEAIKQNLDAVEPRDRISISNELDRVNSVFDSWRSGDLGIGGPFEAKPNDAEHLPNSQQWSRSAEAAEADRKRDAILALEASSVLNRIATQSTNTANGDDDIRRLLGHLAAHPLAVPPGMVPQLQKTPKLVKDPVEVWQRMQARITKCLRKLDEKYDTQLSLHIPSAAVEDSAPASEIEKQAHQWGQAWSMATVAIGIEMLLEKYKSLEAAIRSLPSGGLNAARSGCTLPTDKKDRALRFTLSATPVVCQTLEEDEQHWDAVLEEKTYSQVKVQLRRLDEARPKDTVPRHYGRNVRHYYTAVMIEILALLPPMEPHTTMNSSSGNDNIDAHTLPDPLHLHVPKGHWPTVSALVEWHAQRRQDGSKDQQTSIRLVGDVSQYETVQNGDAVRELPNGELKLTDAPAVRPDCIAQLCLPWHQFQQGQYPCEWIDLVIIVRYQGQWHVLTAGFEDIDDESGEWSLLSVDPRAPEQLPNELLREAIYDAEWRYRHAGTGVLLSGLINLDG